MEAIVKIVKSIFDKVAEVGKKRSYIEWETVAQCTAASMNSLPIARNEDSRNPKDMEDFGLTFLWKDKKRQDPGTCRCGFVRSH